MGAEIVESASGDDRPQEENGERKLPSIRPALTGPAQGGARGAAAPGPKYLGALPKYMICTCTS
jgi:hypothetical protein